MMRGKVDANQGEIVDALRRLGATVCDLSQVGDGCPDLLVGWRGDNFLLEIKTKAGTKTPHQIKWHDRWRGQVAIVRSIDDARAVIGMNDRPPPSTGAALTCPSCRSCGPPALFWTPRNGLICPYCGGTMPDE